MNHTTTLLDVVGLAANLAGVLLLFRYGMPFAVRTGGVVKSFLLLAEPRKDPKLVAKERYYNFLGWAGLATITIGTTLQIIAAIRSQTT